MPVMIDQVDFQGKSVVITGAASGIGLATDRAFAVHGARVALIDRDRAGVERAAGDLPGAEHAAFVCDVSSYADIVATFAAIRARYPVIDVLVNNAGITHLGRLVDTDVDVIRRVMDVSFFGALHCTKAALPSLLARRGQVIAVSSVAGVAPLTGRTGYSAAKHALHGFFDTLREEHHADGLRVMVVCPSFVDTAIGAHALGPDGGPAPAEARTGVKAPVSPELLAEAVVGAARRNQRLLLFPREARLAYWLARLSPRTYGALMRRRTGAGS